MIYTVGNTKNYLRYIAEQGSIRKGIGGSVWLTRRYAEDYLELIGQPHTFSVFGVDAKWADARPIEGVKWRELTASAPIVHLQPNHKMWSLDWFRNRSDLSIARTIYDIECNLTDQAINDEDWDWLEDLQMIYANAQAALWSRRMEAD